MELTCWFAKCVFAIESILSVPWLNPAWTFFKKSWQLVLYPEITVSVPFFVYIVLKHPDESCTLNYLLKTPWWALSPQYFLRHPIVFIFPEYTHADGCCTLNYLLKTLWLGAVPSVVSWKHPDGCCTLNCFLKTSWWVLYPQLFPVNILMGAVPSIISCKHPDGCCTLNYFL